MFAPVFLFSCGEDNVLEEQDLPEMASVLIVSAYIINPSTS